VRAFLACTALCVGTACPADPRDNTKSHVIALIGDEPLHESELVKALAQHGTARIADPAARATVARAILDEMVIEHLMLKAAERSGITVRDADVDREVRGRAEGYPAGTFQRLLAAEQLTLSQFTDKVRRRLVQDAFLRARLALAPAITEDEIKARFEAALKERKFQEQVRARQILVKTAEEALHILEQINAKKLTFEAAAQKFSTAPDADQGGDQGWFSRGELPDVFDICFNLEKGTISDVVISDYGFHLFQIVDRRDEHQEDLESAGDRIEREIVRERQDEAYQKLVLELRQQAKITIYDSAVDRVVALLPPAPITPAEVPENARALDSLPSAIDPVPAVPGKEIKQ
jgi:parvulin-like peptidyl-prolyl isomerase